MSMISFPFDSHVTYDESGNPQYDRAVTSEPYRKLIKEMFTTGIDPKNSASFQVGTGSDMTVRVSAGFAIVEGLMSKDDTTRTLAVTSSDTTYDRIDSVVLRLDDNDDTRICDLYVVAGIPSANPVHPDLTRSGSIYEIGLADLYITKNSTQIIASKITDTRYDNERCGVIAPIAEIDTSTLDQLMQEYQTEERASFEAWVDSIKDILDSSTAGHLQLEIAELQGDLAEAQTDITQLNSNLGNLQFRITDEGKAEKSLDGGTTWENFSNGEGAELLWTNPSPKSTFSAQTISLNLSEYNYVLIESNFSIENTNSAMQLLPIPYSQKGTGSSIYDGSATVWRNITSVTLSGISFNNCGKGQSGTITTNNGGCIPTRIWGCKAMGDVPPQFGERVENGSMIVGDMYYAFIQTYNPTTTVFTQITGGADMLWKENDDVNGPYHKQGNTYVLFRATSDTLAFTNPAQYGTTLRLLLHLK